MRDIKTVGDLTDDGFDKAYEKFVIDYQESIIDYMRQFYFDEKGNCYQWEDLTGEEQKNLA